MSYEDNFSWSGLLSVLITGVLFFMAGVIIWSARLEFPNKINWITAGIASLVIILGLTALYPFIYKVTYNPVISS